MYVLTERDWTGMAHVLVGLLLVAAAAALLLVSVDDGAHADPAPSPVAAPSAGARPRVTIQEERAGRSFAVAGASFRVSPHPAAGWASAVRRTSSGSGRRWLIVAIAVENLGRSRFDPSLLPYLLRGGNGTLFAPYRAGVVGPAGLGEAGGLPIGAHAEERLVYRVPVGLRRPVLSIQPSPARALEVRLPLGAMAGTQ